jgi:predicted SAM-dependent methyltransferase
MVAVGATTRRLNWGCGSEGVPGWINADRKEGPGIEISCDIREGLPLATDSIDYAVSIHALPEIPYQELDGVLRELRRVLKPGGALRLGLPDLDKGIDAYRRGDRFHFLIPDHDAERLGTKFILHMIWYGYTRTLFVRDFAQEVLLTADFRRIEHVGFQATSTPWPEIVELDDRPVESFFVEAYK